MRAKITKIIYPLTLMLILCLPLLCIPLLKHQIFNLTYSQRIQCLVGCILSFIYFVTKAIYKSNLEYYISAFTIAFLFLPIISIKYIFSSYFIFYFMQCYLVFLQFVFEMQIQKIKKIIKNEEKKDE